MGTIFNVQKYSLHDGPGIRTTVFFKGCPLSCQWCHNPESQGWSAELLIRTERCIGCGTCAAACPRGAIDPAALVTARARCTACGMCASVCPAQARVMVGRTVTLRELLAEIEEDVVFYDESGGGVTFSGGEPLAQPGFLADLCDACRERGIHTAVDTCGFVPRETLLAIAEKTGLFLYDLKLMDPAGHQRYTGVANQPILENLRALAAVHRAIVVRIPLISGINDDEENITATGRFLASLPVIQGVALLPYHDTGRHKYARLGKAGPPGEKAPAPAVVERARRILQGFNLAVSIGG